MDKFIPDMYYKSIFDINYKKLKKMKIKCTDEKAEYHLTPSKKSA